MATASRTPVYGDSEDKLNRRFNWSTDAMIQKKDRGITRLNRRGSWCL